MHFSTLLVTTLVTCAIQTRAYSQTDRRVSSFDNRQATSADQMVQNILQWLQSVYSQGSRRVRQGTLREYLPPANTESPRPFQPGYPPSGISPEPPFPFPTSPVTGGVTSPDGYQTEADNNLLPPDQRPGYSERPSVQPGFTLPTAGPSTVQPAVSTTSYPGAPETEQPTQRPAIPEGQPGYSTGQPSFTGGPSTIAPGPDAFFTSQPGGSTLRPEQTPASITPYTSPPEGRPQTFPEGTSAVPDVRQPGISTSQPEPIPGEATRLPEGPATTQPPLQQTTISVSPQQPSEPSEQPGPAEGTISPRIPGIVTTEAPGAPEAPTPSAGGPSLPSGFTTTTEKPADASSAVAGEAVSTTLSPEANTIPGPGSPEPSLVDEEDLKHPPHIHAIDVECSKEMMTINLEFNREFNGVIYSKGYYNSPECRYVQENSGQTKYSFTVNLQMCGTEFVNAFDTQNQSYLENILVLQNEPGIQEVWDTVRSVRCLWEGNIKDTLSVAFSIGMLSQEIITFSGDTAMAKLDVVLGRGPFGEPANGLVKIGEQMTLVVSVSGDPGFDLQVKDCKAVDSETKNTVALTDEDGCILKPKLFGAFQKTKDTGSTGASIIAYAFFNAFKFPDQMDLMIECNIELCKTDCDICPKEGQLLEPARRRRRREASYNGTVAGDWVTMGKLVRVILPEDLNENTALEVSASRDHICMTTTSFVFSSGILISLLVLTSFACACLWMNRRGEKMYLKY